MTVEIINSAAEAIAHINQHGSHHTDCIVTQSRDHALMFTQGVDSACTFVNASTLNVLQSEPGTPFINSMFRPARALPTDSGPSPPPFSHSVLTSSRRFGLGAEVGVSTSRLHARGPVGIQVEGLMATVMIAIVICDQHDATVHPTQAES